MVGRLVEHEAVGAPGHEQRQLGSGPLAGRQRSEAHVRPRPRPDRTWRAASVPRWSAARSRRGSSSRAARSASKRRLAWPSSPNTTPGPIHRLPSSSGSVPRIIPRAASSCRLRCGPRIPSRSPQPSSRSIGPRCQSPRRTTARLEPGDDVAAARRSRHFEMELPGLEGLCPPRRGGRGRVRSSGPWRPVSRCDSGGSPFAPCRCPSGFLAAFATPVTAHCRCWRARARSRSRSVL